MVKRCRKVFLLAALTALSAASAAPSAANQDMVLRRWTTKDGLSENTVVALAQEPDGTLRVETPRFTVHFDGISFSREETRHAAPRTTSGQAPDIPALKEYKALCSFVETNGVIWVGTEGDGLLCLRSRLVAGVSKETERKTASFAGPTGHVWTASVTMRGGDTYAGTDGDGLWLFPKDGSPPRRVCEQAGAHVRALFVDCEKALWIGARGDAVTRFKDGRAKTVHVTTIGGAEKLSFHEAPRGRLWLATDKTLISFSIQDFKDAANSPSAQFKIDSFGALDGYSPSFVDGCRISMKAYDALRRMPPPHVLFKTQARKFSPDEDGLSLDYTTDAPGMADHTRFSVRLLPRQKKWDYVMDARRQTYSNLPPGSYRFEVRARFPFGSWSETAVLEFEVTPHFYETTAFRLFVIGLMLVLTFLTARFIYLRRLRRRLNVVKQRNVLQMERMRIARDIHDDIGARLTRISILADMSAGQNSQFAMIADEVRDVVGALDEVVWAVEPRNDTLSAFTDYIYNYAETYVESVGLRFRADVPGDLPDALVTSKVRHAIYMCVKEALNNAVKHAAAQTIYMSLTFGDHAFEVVIADDGKGYSGPREGGNGIGNMKARMADVGGSFRIGRRTGGGCETTFSAEFERKEKQT